MTFHTVKHGLPKSRHLECESGERPRRRECATPRSFFRFAPLVPPKNDEWDLLKNAAKKLAAEKTMVRGVPITEELYDLILFCVRTPSCGPRCQSSTR